MMDIKKRIAAYFGAQYVLVRFFDGGYEVKRARKLCGTWAIRTFHNLPDTTAILKPQGEISGKTYLKSWLPLTQEVERFYNMEAKND